MLSTWADARRCMTKPPTGKRADLVEATEAIERVLRERRLL